MLYLINCQKRRRIPKTPPFHAQLGHSNSIMHYVILEQASILCPRQFDKLNHTPLSPTPICLQLADQSVRYLAAIAGDIPIRIKNCIIPVDFVVLDIRIDTNTAHSWETIPTNCKRTHRHKSQRNYSPEHQREGREVSIQTMI